MSFIENSCPGLVQAVAAEGDADTAAAIEYSWASHRRRLDIIERRQRRPVRFFDSVAGKVDEKTDRYFVCQV